MPARELTDQSEPGHRNIETSNSDRLSEDTTFQKTQLLEYVSEAVFDSDLEEKYQYLVVLENDTYKNWYQGYSEINFPWIKDKDIRRNYWLKTSTVSGTFSTPYFKKPFNANTFDRQLGFAVKVRMPDHIKNRSDISIVLQIDYDLETRSDGEWVRLKAGRFDVKLTHQVLHLPVSEDLEGKSSV